MNKVLKKCIAFGGCVSMLFLLVLPTHPAEASIVTDFSDTMTSQVAGALSNHTISFVTRTGAVEGLTLIFTFASTFDTGSVNFDDIDLAVSGVDRTIAATCAGTEQLSASFASDILTITVCAGDGGAIAASSTVVIEIGTHATFGATGNAQIVNPASAGSATIILHGSFGDRGSLAVAIASPGSVAVSGVVNPSGGGGGGGGGFIPPGGGGILPAISQIQVTNITETSATVIWKTDEPADSRVDYGLTASYEISSRSDVSLVASHSIPLDALSPDTLYHFRVRSRDQAGDEALSVDLTFRTLGPPDTTRPIISDIQVIEITGSSGRVVWFTNEPGTSRVDYGRTVNYEIGSREDGALVTEHRILLSGLTSETTYQLRVRSTDAAGNEAMSGNVTFRTRDVTAPAISDLQIIDITETSARVRWTTNEPATSAVAYGATAQYERGVVSKGSLVVSHEIMLNGLLPNTVHHLEAGSIDVEGNQAMSGDRTFRTLPDRTPPPNVSDFTAREIGPGTVHLSWTNPPVPDFSGARIVRRTDRSPRGPNDGIVVVNSQGTEYTDRGLSAGTTYHYGVFAFDTSGNFASGALAQVTLSAICGDDRCTRGETPESCPRDCVAPPKPVCGNTVCEAGETPQNCSLDCGLPPSPPPVCGNAICEVPETTDSCQNDCPVPPRLPICGNNVCEVGETPESCSLDCPVIPVPPPSVGDGERLELSDLHLLVGNQRIEIFPINGTYVLLPGTVLWARVSIESFLREPEEVRLILGASAYLLTRTDRGFETSLITPTSLGIGPLNLSIIYPDGSTDRLDARMSIEPLGRVVTEVRGNTVAVPQAVVTLFDSQGNLWDGQAYGQENPLLSTTDGTFAWYVPIGEYRILVRRDGYRDEERSWSASRGIVNPEVVLILLPEPFIETVGEVLTRGGSLREKILTIGDLLGERFDYDRNVLQREILDRPEVEKVARTIAAPALAVLATASAGAAAASAVGIINLLHYLLTQPLMFFARRKRKGWGVVYNAFTKLPIELAVVRLRESESGKLIQTRVTDRRGRYFFIAQPGTYLVEVQKQGYRSPSQYLKDATRDEVFLDLYHGEPIIVTGADATIAANIPIDPEVRERLPGVILRQVFFRRLEEIIAIVSPILAGITALIKPTRFTIGLFLFQVVVYVIFRFLVRARKSKGWGIVYDATTKQPLSRAVVRIFEPVYGKLLDMQVTDRKGRYAFLTGPNIYRIGAEKTGYVAGSLEVDLRSRKEPEVIREPVKLERKENDDEEWKPEPS